jgi:hypothetical protein
MRIRAAGRSAVVKVAIDEAALEHERSLTIPQFLFVENISKTTFYKLKKQGLAPVITTILDTHRITAQSRRDWHAMMHMRQATSAAALLAERKAAQASAAGKLAAASPNHHCRRKQRRGKRR